VIFICPYGLIDLLREFKNEDYEDHEEQQKKLSSGYQNELIYGRQLCRQI